MDIKAQINDDSVIDIEMQVTNEYNIQERSTYYLVKMSSEELKAGEKYTDIKKAIVINILSFNYFKRNSYMNVAHMKFEKCKPETYVDMGYKEEEEIATKDLEMIFIELPKFVKKNPDAESSLNKWLWLIAGREEKVKMAKTTFEEIEKAKKILEELSLDRETWEAYESRERAIFNYNTSMEKARRRGLEEGRKEKEEELKMKEEEIKNKEEEIKSKGEAIIEIVKKLLQRNMSIEEIESITGLSKEEVEKIKM